MDRTCTTVMSILRPGSDKTEQVHVAFQIPKKPTGIDAIDYQRDDFDLPLFPGPGLEQIKAVVMPALGQGAELERVRVLWNGRQADMFVDEIGGPKYNRRPRNDAATAIYRAATLRLQPALDPESLPAIYGVAAIFDDRIWF